MSSFQPTNMGDHLKRQAVETTHLGRSLGGLLRPKFQNYTLPAGISGTFDLNRYGSRLVVLTFSLVAGVAPVAGQTVATLSSGNRPSAPFSFVAAAGWELSVNLDGTIAVTVVGTGTTVSGAVSFTAGG